MTSSRWLLINYSNTKFKLLLLLKTSLVFLQIGSEMALLACVTLPTAHQGVFTLWWVFLSDYEALWTCPGYEQHTNSRVVITSSFKGLGCSFCWDIVILFMVFTLNYCVPLLCDPVYQAFLNMFHSCSDVSLLFLLPKVFILQHWDYR